MRQGKRHTPDAAPEKGRRLGREIAFQVLYGLPFLCRKEGALGCCSFDRSEDVVVDSRMDGQDLDYPARTANNVAAELDKVRDFAHELVLGVIAHQTELDEVITRFSQNWKINRIAKVELAILRLALYEMLHTDMPLKAAINEAVELSKRFGDENSRNFINGILDAAAKAISHDELGQSKQF